MSSWMILSATEGTGNKQFTIGAEDLNSTAMREGVVTVTEDSGRKANVRAVQYGKPSLDRRAPYNDIIAGGGGASVSITSYGRWCIVAEPSMPDWITIMTDDGDTYDEGDWFPPCGYSKEDCPDSTSDTWRTFSVGMGQNTSSLSRSVKLKLRYERLDGNITDSDFIEIKQQGVVKDIDVPATPTTKGEVVEGMTTWVATTDANWITITKRTGLRGEQVEFETLENTGYKREGIITITYSDGTVELMRINQASSLPTETRIYYRTQAGNKFIGNTFVKGAWDADGNPLTYTESVGTYSEGDFTTTCVVLEFNGIVDTMCWYQTDSTAISSKLFFAVYHISNKIKLVKYNNYGVGIAEGSYSGNVAGLMDLRNLDFSLITDTIGTLPGFQLLIDDINVLEKAPHIVNNNDSPSVTASIYPPLDYSKFHVENTRDFSQMFANNKSSILDLSSWVMKPTSTRYMFAITDTNVYRGKLTTVTGLDTWDMRDNTDMEYMFANQFNFQDIAPIEEWKCSSLKKCNHMFYRTAVGGDVDLSGWDSNSLYGIDGMFYETGLTSIKMPQTDLMYTNNGNVFRNCPNLRDVDLTLVKINYKGVDNWFNGCTNLNSIKIGNNCLVGSATNMFTNVPSGGTLYYPAGMDATNVAKWTPSGWTAVAY